MKLTAYVANRNENGPAPGEPGLEVTTLQINASLKVPENAQLFKKDGASFGLTLQNLTDAEAAAFPRGKKLAITIEAVE